MKYHCENGGCPRPGSVRILVVPPKHLAILLGEKERHAWLCKPCAQEAGIAKPG